MLSKIVQRLSKFGLYLHSRRLGLKNSSDGIGDFKNVWKASFKFILAQVLLGTSIFLMYYFGSSVDIIYSVTENQSEALNFNSNHRRSLQGSLSIDITNLRENMSLSAVDLGNEHNYSTRYTVYKEMSQLMETFNTKDGKNISDIECNWGDTHIKNRKSPLYLTEYHKDISKFLGLDYEFRGHHNCSVARDILYSLAEQPFHDLLDLVVIVSENTNLDLLIRNWEIELRNYHTIFILDNSAKEIPMNLPAWLKYEMHTVSSISSSLGRNGWVIGSSNGGFGDGASMRAVGEWISLKEYVYVILDSNKMSSGDSCLSVLERHLFNVLTPVIDDYRHCQEDEEKSNITPALTNGRQLALNNHQNTKTEHRVGEKGIISARKTFMSIELNRLSPHLMQTNQLYFNVPLGMNHLLLKFNNCLLRGRLFANSLLLFIPSEKMLYGGANFTEFVDAAPIISAWMTKAYLDWIRGGAKVYLSSSEDTGQYKIPVKVTFNRKILMYDLQQPIAKEFGSKWSQLNKSVQNMLAVVFHRINSFNISEANMQHNSQCTKQLEHPLTCYTTELIKYVFSSNLEIVRLDFDDDEKIRYFIEYMFKISTAWFEIWASRKLFANNLHPVAVQSYYAPKYKSCAIITISHNEADLFPVWFRYYSRYFEHRDMFVLDHITTDGSLDRLPRDVNLLKFNNKHAMPVHERSDIIRFYQDFLLRQGYKCIVYTDVDEIIVPDPIAYPGGLKEYLKKFLDNEKLTSVKVKAYDLGHMSYGDGGKPETIEPPIEWRNSILDQRSYAAENRQYDKALITKIPLDYRPGFHKLYDIKLDFSISVDTQLVMFHLSSFDKDWCFKRMKYKGSLVSRMKQGDYNGGYADHWKRASVDIHSMGILCRYAISCLMPGPESDPDTFQIEGSTTKFLAFDNLGQVKMWKIPQRFRSVIV